MIPQESKFKSQYARIITAFEAAFPGIAPPEPHWFALWLAKYRPCDIADAIQALSQHPLKSRFTQESTGKAISAHLRNAALQRAVADTKAVRP